jgi:hypothetical protein
MNPIVVTAVIAFLVGGLVLLGALAAHLAIRDAKRAAKDEGQLGRGKG